MSLAVELQILFQLFSKASEKHSYIMCSLYRCHNMCSWMMKIMITWDFMNTNNVSWVKKLSLWNISLMMLETVEVKMQDEGG